jgi:predicted PurR-regulated permease PerM
MMSTLRTTSHWENKKHCATSAPRYHTNMNDSFARIQQSFFFILLAGVTVAFVWLLKDFLIPVLWAVTFAVLFYPLSQWFTLKLGGRRTLGASLTLLFVLLIVLLPLYGLGTLLATQAVDTYFRLASPETTQYLTTLEQTPFAQQTLSLIGIEEGGLRDRIIEAGRTASSWFATQVFSIGADAASIILKTFVMLYLLFVFLRNGASLGAHIMRVLPLGNAKEIHLFDRFASTTRALFRGTVIVSLIQGIVGGVLFLIAGVPNAFLWGAVMAVCALIPAVGPGIVWLPAGLILLALGDVTGAAVVLGGGLVVVSLLDNILRPILIGHDTQMPDALVLLSIFGGLATIGMSGLVVGPIIASLFLALWSLFEQEYRPQLAQRG